MLRAKIVQVRESKAKIVWLRALIASIEESICESQGEVESTLMETEKKLATAESCLKVIIMKSMRAFKEGGKYCRTVLSSC